jgi:hypothetical protein
MSCSGSVLLYFYKINCTPSLHNLVLVLLIIKYIFYFRRTRTKLCKDGVQLILYMKLSQHDTALLLFYFTLLYFTLLYWSNIARTKCS